MAKRFRKGQVVKFFGVGIVQASERADFYDSGTESLMITVDVDEPGRHKVRKGKRFYVVVPVSAVQEVEPR